MWLPGFAETYHNRRHFLKHMAGFSAAFALPSFQFVNKLAAAAPQMKRDHKSLVVLWMGGGPSHMDTWDMKPGESTGGDFRPMKTAASGVEICEHLPTVAQQMKNLSIIRSLVSNEGSHERGTYLLHTAYAQNPAVAFPSIGAMTSYQNLSNHASAKDLALPGFISISRPAEGPGFLGMAYAPFTVQNPGSPPQNINPPSELGADAEQYARMKRRYELFNYLETGFTGGNRGEASRAHADIYRKAFDLTASQLKRVFDLQIENDGKRIAPKVLDDYGRNGFGQGCLIARKLVEAGVSCVEIGLGGWDNHNNIFSALHNNRPGQGGLVDRLDKGFGTLMKELDERGLLKNTVVVWMGEFGRTPRINQNAGRDHWGRCWSVVVGGGNLKGGQVYGSTDKDGTGVKGDPVSVGDLFATIYQGLGISPDTEVRDPLGRPRKITGEKGGKPIAALV
jgi:hypothetical protein